MPHWPLHAFRKSTLAIAARTKFLYHNEYRELVFRRNLDHSFSQTRRVLFVLLLIAVATFFAGLCTLALADAKRIAVGNNPYDLAYAEFDGKEMLSSQLTGILRDEGAFLTSHKTLDFVKASAKVILSDAALKLVSDFSSDVSPDHFIWLVQQFTDDNHPPRNTSAPATLSIQGRQFLLQRQLVAVLFGNVPLVVAGTAGYAILNDADYHMVRNKANPKSEIGRVVLLRFTDWLATERASTRLAQELLHTYTKGDTAYAGLSPQERDEVSRLYAPASRITYFQELRQSARFTLFLFIFVATLFFTAGPIVLHFKLLTDFQQEIVKYRRLFKIGISPSEIRRAS